MKHTAATYGSLGRGFDERNDCAIRAIATAACMDYSAVHAVFMKYGRKRKGKTYPMTLTVAMAELFPDIKHVGVARGMTLKRFTELHPAGHYVVQVRGHMLAVCDGIIHDWESRPRRSVRSFYKLCD